MRINAIDHLAVQVENEAQHAMCGRVLRAEINCKALRCLSIFYGVFIRDDVFVRSRRFGNGPGFIRCGRVFAWGGRRSDAVFVSLDCELAVV
jgi:hypothetical protein